MLEQFYRIDYWAVPPQERPGMRRRVKNLSVLVPVKPDYIAMMQAHYDIYGHWMDREEAQRLFNIALGIGGNE